MYDHAKISGWGNSPWYYNPKWDNDEGDFPDYINEIVRKKAEGSNVVDDLGFLLDLLGFGGEELYDCAMRTFALFSAEFYEFVPNAVRMFYECFVINFFGGVEYCIQNEYGTPDIKKTVDEYFTNTYKTTAEDKKFYNQIFKEDWKKVNAGSHYLSREGKTLNEMIEEDNCFLYNLVSSCEYFYFKKKGKSIKCTVDVQSLKNQAQEFKQIISDAYKENKSLKQELLKIKSDNKRLITKFKELQSRYETLSKDKNQQTQKIDNLEKEITKLLNKNASIDSSEKIMSKNVPLGQAQKETADINLLENVLEVIKYMNHLRCYATVVTITNIFKGITNTPQILCYPDLKKCRFYDSNKNISCDNVNSCIDKLIKDKKIYKSSGRYKAFK